MQPHITGNAVSFSAPTRQLMQETGWCWKALGARTAVPRSTAKGQRPSNSCAWSTSDLAEVLRFKASSLDYGSPSRRTWCCFVVESSNPVSCLWLWLVPGMYVGFAILLAYICVFAHKYTLQSCTNSLLRLRIFLFFPLCRAFHEHRPREQSPPTNIGDSMLIHTLQNVSAAVCGFHRLQRT